MIALIPSWDNIPITIHEKLRNPLHKIMLVKNHPITIPWGQSNDHILNPDKPHGII